MSLDLDRVNGLLNLVKEAAQHPAQLAPLGQLAMRELQGHAAEAKKEHDKILVEEAAKAAEVKAAADVKAKEIADKDAKSAALTSKPIPVARPAEGFVRQPAEPTEGETVRRRDVPQEEAHG